MKVSVEKLVILTSIIFFSYGLISMSLFAISSTAQSIMFFIFGMTNWVIGILLLSILYYRLFRYINKLKKGVYEPEDE